ncbi:thiamine pyrophosphate-binding protein [Geomesophilobacter sediminis]|uniref:Thiamine pyrophosphate-binding protein n=1 Tax=Geomesophilobacter sediminis TaxID=2798584 RepID=A0A8J7J4S5_9BACT|nr:thiamine pyrophosphate-binding protein [Geomesophilobacter sediminis]MBJ6723221.1 thiamine pyrophosphate-binding protein [Geomesophilobacter sediminis]
MTGQLPSRSGGRILVDALKIHGVDVAFCVPGESFLPVLDALYDEQEAIRLIVCRQEGGAAYMAEAFGKLTGRPGICFVTRGPGATNASVGVHTAYQDSTPLILFVGQVGGALVEREAFQEIDFRRMFGQMAKWVGQIDRAERIPELVSRAFHLAVSGRPGPVVLALPEEMLSSQAAVADVGAYRRVQAHPGADSLAELWGRLTRAERPLLLLGGGDWSAAACADIAAFAVANGLPVACAFRRQDLFDNRLGNYLGDVGIGINPALAERVREADLILAVGARLDEMTTSSYTLIVPPRPRQKLVHVHPGYQELGRVYQADLMINSGIAEFAAGARRLPPIPSPSWRGWTEAGRQEYLSWLQPHPAPFELDLGAVVAWLRERLPEDALVTNGAGNYSAWVHRYYRYPGFRTQLAPVNGSMGYGVPAAVAAKVVHPDRTVVCFAGDGCFLMNGQELATAVQYNLAVVIIVVNNGMYGTIRMHQERRYPGRVSGTELSNPDFAALARAYGAFGEVVERTADFAGAFERAVACGGPALVELRVDPEAITPRMTIGAIREEALTG